MEWNQHWLWIYVVCRLGVHVVSLTLSLVRFPCISDWLCKVKLLYGAAPVTPFCWHRVDLCPLLWEWDRCTRTIIHFHTCPLTSFNTDRLHAKAEGHSLLRWRDKCRKTSLTFVVFISRWFRGRDQATKDHHHRKAAGDPQKCLQKLTKASTSRQRAAVLRDGAGHESGAGRGFWSPPVCPR